MSLVRDNLTPMPGTCFALLGRWILLLLACLPLQRSWAQWAVYDVDDGIDAGWVGEYASLASVNGHPAIAYYDDSNKCLKYVRATNPEGTTWGDPMAIDVPPTNLTTRNVGEYCSLAVIQGHPAIAYESTVAGASGLMFIRATDADGTNWGARVVVEAGNLGDHASLAMINGHPAISYHTFQGDLKYARAADANGETWGAPIALVTSGIDVGEHSTLMEVNGSPAISFMDSGNLDVKYIRATDANGTTWGAPLILVDADASQTSLAIVNGNPAVAYYENNNLKFVRATDVNGTAWGTKRFPDYGGTGYVGSSACLEVISGHPAISYLDSTNGDLLFVRASDTDGAIWGTPMPLDTEGSVGAYTSLKVIAGNPAIAYFDMSNRDLKFVRATNDTGTQWGTPIVVDRGQNGEVGDFASLEMVDGMPAIAYFDETGTSLRYIRASAPYGTAWGYPVTIDATGTVGRHASLEVVNGHPAVTYYDGTNRDLKYARATGPDGSTWNPPMMIDATGDVGEDNSLAVIGGNPAVAYYDASNRDLKFVRSSDGNGTAWSAPMTLDSAGDVGEFASLRLVNNHPAIAYLDETNRDLKYIRANNPEGTDWGAPISVDTAGNVGEYASLAIVGGFPAIAYYEYGNDDLKFVRASDADGTTWNAPISLDTTGDVGRNTSLAIVNGKPAISYLDNTTDDLKFIGAADGVGSTWEVPEVPSIIGAAAISLASLNESPGIAFYDGREDDLKFAVQLPVGIPSPTPSPSPTPTRSPTPSPSSSPTRSPTASPSATPSPSPTPSPTPFNDAMQLNHTIPPIIAPGQIKVVGITVTNTGNTTWTPQGPNGFALGARTDPCALASNTRFDLLPGDSVLPGQQHQFIGQLLAPGAPQDCEIEFQMVQEFVEWFGESLVITISIEEPANAVKRWERYE